MSGKRGPKPLKEVLAMCKEAWNVYLGSQGKIVFQPMRCNTIFCEECRPLRQEAIYRKAMKVVEVFEKEGKPYNFLTLTMPPEVGTEGLKKAVDYAMRVRMRFVNFTLSKKVIERAYEIALEEVQRIEDEERREYHLKLVEEGYQKLLENYKVQLRKLFRGLWVVEITYNEEINRWNVHYHILTDLQLSVFLISGLVRQLGFGSIVHISRVNGGNYQKVGHYISKVLSYMSKLSVDMTLAEEVYLAMYRRPYARVIGMEIEDEEEEEVEEDCEWVNIGRLERISEQGRERIDNKEALPEGRIYKFHLQYLPLDVDIPVLNKRLYVRLDRRDEAVFSPLTLCLFRMDGTFWVAGTLTETKMFAEKEYVYSPLSSPMPFVDYLRRLQEFVDMEEMEKRALVMSEAILKKMRERESGEVKYSEYGWIYYDLFIRPLNRANDPDYRPPSEAKETEVWDEELEFLSQYF